MKVMFIVGQALGHVGRSLMVARALRELCPTEIIFAGNNPWGYLEQYVLSSGFRIVPVGETPTIPPEIYATRLEEVFATTKPDIIVFDASPVPWLIYTRIPPVPQAYLTNYFLTGLGVLPTSQDRFFDRNKEICNRYRENIGLGKLQGARELYEKDAVILADSEYLIPGNTTLPANYKVAGGIWWEPEVPLPEELRSVSGILYISVGSTGQPVPDVLVGNILRYFDVRHIVEASARQHSLSSFGDIPISSYATLSGSRILNRSVFAITQGGAGSTYQALKAGVPIGLWPNHSNHWIMARRLEELGVGFILDPGTIDKTLAYMKDNWQKMLRNTRQFRTMDPVRAARSAAQSILDLR